MSTEAEQEKARTLLEGEVATRTHIQDVSRLMSVCAAELLVRGSHHDESKLGPEEHEKFSLAAARFKEPGNEFGTEGYEKTKEWLGSALAHPRVRADASLREELAPPGALREWGDGDGPVRLD